MPDAIETGLYLLTPTHVGTGTAAGAVDLPIARERHTDHPYIPATALKGVARDLFGDNDRDPERVRLFGPPPPQKEDPKTEQLVAGDLVLTDGHLLAFPVRSLNAAFYWVTCPLVVERWRRLRGTWGLKLPDGDLPTDAATASFAPPSTLVIEDHVVRGATRSAALVRVAAAWARLLPQDDRVAARLTEALLCIPDADFKHLVSIATPVNARVQLTEGKTADSWTSDDGRTQKGNLWYEETLPSDCLISVVVAARSSKGPSVGAFEKRLRKGQRVQIGGNETVGQGVAWWRAEGGDHA